tara:strand:- start:186 stop:872 length:687 start_codon:yes stop_codon:yes gene_type:complete
VKNEYDKNLASFYNHLNGLEKYKKEVEFLNTFIEKKCKILDIGCGTGIHIHLLSHLGHQCTGIDKSKDMIDVATKNNETKAKFLNTSIENFETKEKFDLCISLFNVVNHVLEFDSLKLFFLNVIKSLKSGGLFVFDCFNSIAVIKDRPKVKHSAKTKVTPDYNPYTGVLKLQYSGHNNFQLTNRVWDFSLILETLKQVGFEVEYYKRNTLSEPSDEDYKITFVCRRTT